MAEPIHVFQTVGSHGGRQWTIEAWGEGREDGRWEGWLVFVPADGSPPLATPRETTQSNRQALEYWARGLAPIYLEGAFSRAVARAA
jgi:hypothetical protein